MLTLIAYYQLLLVTYQQGLLRYIPFLPQNAVLLSYRELKGHWLCLF